MEDLQVLWLSQWWWICLLPNSLIVLSSSCTEEGYKYFSSVVGLSLYNLGVGVLRCLPPSNVFGWQSCYLATPRRTESKIQILKLARLPQVHRRVRLLLVCAHEDWCQTAAKWGWILGILASVGNWHWQANHNFLCSHRQERYAFKFRTILSGSGVRCVLCSLVGARMNPDHSEIDRVRIREYFEIHN